MGMFEEMKKREENEVVSTLNFTVAYNEKEGNTYVKGEVRATYNAMEDVVLALIDNMDEAKKCHKTKILKELTLKLMLLAMEEDNV